MGVIRMKMCTPMLAGAPPPKFPGNQPIKDESHISKWITDMKYYAKYLIDQEAKLNLTKFNVATVLILSILLQHINITELFLFSRFVKFVCVNFFVFFYKIIISKFV